MNRGFISTLVVIILALAAAKYFFDWSIFDAAATPEGQGTVTYVRRILDVIWSYIGYPIAWIWNEIVMPILRVGFGSLQELIQNRGFSFNDYN